MFQNLFIHLTILIILKPRNKYRMDSQLVLTRIPIVQCSPVFKQSATFYGMLNVPSKFSLVDFL